MKIWLLYLIYELQRGLWTHLTTVHFLAWFARFSAKATSNLPCFVIVNKLRFWWYHNHRIHRKTTYNEVARFKVLLRTFNPNRNYITTNILYGSIFYQAPLLKRVSCVVFTVGKESSKASCHQSSESSFSVFKKFRYGSSDRRYEVSEKKYFTFMLCKMSFHV